MAYTKVTRLLVSNIRSMNTSTEVPIKLSYTILLSQYHRIGLTIYLFSDIIPTTEYIVYTCICRVINVVISEV